MFLDSSAAVLVVDTCIVYWATNALYFSL